MINPVYIKIKKVYKIRRTRYEPGKTRNITGTG